MRDWIYGVLICLALLASGVRLLEEHELTQGAVVDVPSRAGAQAGEGAARTQAAPCPGRLGEGPAK